MKHQTTTHVRLSIHFSIYLFMSVGLFISAPSRLLAQCPNPTGLSTSGITTNSAGLSWTSNSTPTDNCWVVTLGGSGMVVNAANCPDGGQGLFTTTVCFINNVVSFSAPVTGMSVVGSQITINVGGLQPGTTYNWYVSETCDGIAPPFNVSGCAGPAVFQTLDAQYTVSATTVKPSCPAVSPGYVPNGSFTVTVTNGTTCAGTYTINATPVAGSGPAGAPNPPPTTVTTYIGFPAGAYFFGNAGAGCYTVTVTETGTCNPPTDPVVIVVCVPDGMDMVAPVFYVTDVLGNILADNDPLTAAGTTRNFGNVPVPEGECGRQDEYYVYGFDNCDGFINALNAVSATAVTNPNTIIPPTQVSVTPDGFGFYLVDVHWSTGTSTVSIFGRDAAGNVANNPAGLQLIMTVPDNTDPVVTIIGNSQFTIPVCATSVTGILTFQVDDLCDQNNVNFNNLVVNFGGATGVLNFTGNNYREYFVTFPAAGNYLISASYTDQFGNAGFIDQIITVQSAAADQPPVIQANAETVTLTACQNSATIVYSFTISDDCAPINIAQVQFNGGGSGLPNLNGAGFFFTDQVGGPNNVYFEVQGTVTPGTFFPLITYQGVTANPTITVLQNANQPADIILPGNLTFTVPQCQTNVLATASITIIDDCDNPINPANAVFTLGGAPLTPSFVNAAAGYFEFVLDLTQAANDGDLLVARYTDAQGAQRLVDALVTVNAQPDNWAPIIVYPAQDLIAVLDPCEAPQATFVFQVTAADNCSGNVSPLISVTPTTGITLTPLGSGAWQAIAAPGDYQVLISATDAAGNTRLEDFGIHVEQDATPIADIGCSDTINIVLNEQCQLLATPEMLLEGNFGCLEATDFSIQVQDEDPTNGAIVDGCGIFLYEITLVQPIPGGLAGDFTTCWGYIHAKDQSPPEITCPANTSQAAVAHQVQFISEVLTSSDPGIALADHLCFLDFINPTPGQHYYDLYSFTVTTADVYTFDLATTWGGGWAALFQGNFNINNPCENIIAQGDYVFDGTLTSFFPFDPVVRISLPLVPGQTYTLMTSASGAFGTGLTGGYTWGVYSDGAGTLNGLPVETELVVRDLLCENWGKITVDSLQAQVPRCYSVNKDGQILWPANNLERQRLEQLLAVLSYTGYPGQPNGPSASDNCGNVEICVSDQINLNGDCGVIELVRTFGATDEKGNTDECQQVISIRRPAVTDVFFPPFTTYVECDEQYETDANGHPHPSVTGYPFVITPFGFSDLDQTFCNLAASYFDYPVAFICESTYKIRREWTLFNWCAPSSSATYSQLIGVGDFSGPVVSCPVVIDDWDGLSDSILYSTGPFDCTATFWAPLPEVSDNCSDWSVLTEVVTGVGAETIVLASVPAGATQRYVAGIPEGCHRFRYTVTDVCGNATVLECEFCVLDLTPPIAICNDALNISVGGQGYGRLYAEEADEGSWDNCGISSYQIRRQITEDADCQPVAPDYTPWASYIDFSCCDAGDSVLVELQITDINGQSDVCWFKVWVEDKLRPLCIAPHAVTVSCTDLPYSFEASDTTQLQALFGNAMANDNCPGAYTVELPPLLNLHDCGYGVIIRRFRAIDRFGNQSAAECQQMVVIEEAHRYEIRFPADASANCGIPAPDTIHYYERACDLLAVSASDEFFSASGDECYKIFRTYRVINWCEYDGQSGPVVIGRDEDCDGVPGDEAVWVLRREIGLGYIDRDSLEGNNVPAAGEKPTACDGATNPAGFWRATPSIGYWEYTQIIKVYDNTPPAIYFSPPDPFCSYDNVGCDAEIEYLFLLFETCTPQDIEFHIYLDEGDDGIIDMDLTDFEVIHGQYPKFKAVWEVPIGHHSFYLIVEDGCGNVNETHMPFEVVDCKAPSPICINGLAIDLMPMMPPADADGDGDIDTGAISLSVNDFIASPITDCSSPIKYSIHRITEVPHPGPTSIMLTCDDRPHQVVRIYTWDSAFNPYAVQPDGTVGGPNYDYCETYVLVQDNVFNACGDTPISEIAGIVITEDDEPVEGVQVQLSGAESQSMTTLGDGAYQFSALAQGYDYTVTPFLDQNPLNGVSTFDLLLMTKHILGVQYLDSPYKMIAADVNKSGTITTYDLIQLRRLILFIDSDFASNTSWRFIPAAYHFPNPANPWQEVFPEIININDLAGDLGGQDFIAIKIGDVNGNAVTGLGAIEERDKEGIFRLSANEQWLEKDSTYAVTLTAAELSGIVGFQFTLQWDTTAFALTGVEEGLLGRAHIGELFGGAGILTASWNEEQQRESGPLPMFTMHIKAHRETWLGQLLHIRENGYTPAEAYGRDGAWLGVSIDFSGAESAGKLMFTNQPNPFSEQTWLQFYLPVDDRLTLYIYDANGVERYKWQGELTAGWHRRSISAAEIGEGSVFFGRIETASSSVVGKLIKVAP